MGRNRKITLDKKSIDDTIKVLKDIKKSIDSTSDIENILDEAVQYCIEKSGNFNAHTYWEETSEGYRIVQEGNGVIYVEFGTGVVGEDNPHPLYEQMGMEGYNSRKDHKFIAPDGRDAWTYPKAEGGWGITSGQPARKQMYLTSQWLEEKLGREVLLKVKRATDKW